MSRARSAAGRICEPRERGSQMAARQEAPRRVTVTVLNGFLGAGKTTMLKSLLVQAWKREPRTYPAVIVGEEPGNFARISGGGFHSADRILEQAHPEHPCPGITVLAP